LYAVFFFSWQLLKILKFASFQYIYVGVFSDLIRSAEYMLTTPSVFEPADLHFFSICFPPLKTPPQNLCTILYGQDVQNQRFACWKQFLWIRFFFFRAGRKLCIYTEWCDDHCWTVISMIDVQLDLANKASFRSWKFRIFLTVALSFIFDN
jgi:hypothetical protein